MTDTIQVKPHTAVHDFLSVDRGIAQELRDHFTFEVPGARWNPRFRNRMWDGKIRLFQQDHLLYGGLRDSLVEFADDRGYAVDLDPDIQHDTEFSLTEAAHRIQAMGLSKTPRDYQAKSYVHCVRKNRALVVCPTASGKSFIIHMLLEHFGKRTVVIVPQINLVEQLATNLKEYGRKERMFTSTNRHPREGVFEEGEVYISTWQTLMNVENQGWLNQFDVVIGDEAHGFKAKELRGVMERLVSTPLRFGFTGTLDGTPTHKMVLEGLFGPVHSIVTSAELIERETLARPWIKVIVLGHPRDVREELAARKRALRKSDTDKRKVYAEELKTLVESEPRNRFLRNLCASLKGNTILLFHFVERHGKPLYKELKRMNSRPVYYVAGDVEGSVREEIRNIVNKERNALIVASDGTFAQGVDIPNLNNLILAAPGKGRIKLLQSIGRVLRRSDGKVECTVFDIADDLTHNRWPNYTLQHMVERVRIYNQEGFKYTTYRVALGE